MRRVPSEMFKEFLGSPLLSTNQVASILSVPPATLKWWRIRSVRRGPDFIKLSPHVVRYRVEDLERFLRRQSVRGRSAGR
jgi:hypothetical protein